METKEFWKSKRFWGILFSTLGSTALVIATQLGVESAVKPWLDVLGTILNLVGVPVATIGAVNATKPLGLRKK